VAGWPALQKLSTVWQESPFTNYFSRRGPVSDWLVKSPVNTNWQRRFHYRLGRICVWKTRVKRIVSAGLGLLSACAGMVALFGYAYPATEQLFPPPSGVVVYSQVTLSEQLLAATVIWCLTLGAFFMAFRMLRFALSSRKSMNC